MHLVRALVLAIALTTTACSDPHAQPLPADLSTVENDADFKGAVSKLPDDEKKMLAGYLVRAQLGIQPADRAKTIGDAIAAQKKFQSDQSDARKKADDDFRKVEDKRSGDRAAAGLVRVTIPKYTFMRHDPSKKQMGNHLKATLHVENAGKKATKTLRGFIFVKSAAGESVMSTTPYSIDSAVRPGQTTDIDVNVPLAFAEKNTTFEPAEAGWQAEEYVYEDGQSVLRP